jgi:PadR family transcriptional regulator, regulatory protein PadR
LERKGALGAASIPGPYFCQLPVDMPRKKGIFLGMSKGSNAEAQKSEVLQGTLDLMVLKVLDALGPQHGYGIARRIEQVSEQVLQLNEGTVYTSLLRLQQRKWIASEWGTSENNRKAKYYSITEVRTLLFLPTSAARVFKSVQTTDSITKSGRKELARVTENWERIAGVIGRLLRLEGQE